MISRNLDSYLFIKCLLVFLDVNLLSIHEFNMQLIKM